MQSRAGRQATQEVSLTSSLALHVLAYSCEALSDRVSYDLIVALGESPVDHSVAGVRTITLTLRLHFSVLG